MPLCSPQQSRIPSSSSNTSASRRHWQRRLTVDLGLAAMFNNHNSISACSATSGSRSHTPTGGGSPAMNGSFTLTLPRPERPGPSPKCFGKNTHVLKEDFERERIRWEKKLEEAEQKVADAAIQNSELFQLKAELNRKVLDLEKGQRPLLEQNRRLNERVRTANADTRRLEEKMGHVQDELLTLRDQYERTLKENAGLREQRAFPEKLEELGRYRAQVLEMSKCITALRQSAAEKDRRHEMLVLKLKRMRKAATQDNSDRQSCATGSEGSVEDSGSLGLDTIAEDLDEDVELTAELLIGGRGAFDCVLLRQQLDTANEQLAEMQRELERSQMECADRLGLRAQLDSTRKRERSLELQLANVQAQSELLEFQLVELTEAQQRDWKSQTRREFADKLCSTELSVPVDEEPFDGEPRTRHTLSAEWLVGVRTRMRRAMEDWPLVGQPERMAVRHGLEAMDCLQRQLGFAETELNMANCENGRLQRELEQKEEEWKRQRAEALGERQQRKRELKAELDQLRKERKDEATAFGRQLEELSGALGEKVHAMGDMADRLAQLGAELDICRCQLTAEQTENGVLKGKLEEMEQQRQRAEGECVRLQTKLAEREHKSERLAEEAKEREMAAERAQEERERDRTELDRLRAYNRELEGQFNAQMEMLGALKRRLLALQCQQKGDQTGKDRWPKAKTGAGSCGSNSTDEQYHSEGSDEGQQQQRREAKGAQ